MTHHHVEITLLILGLIATAGGFVAGLTGMMNNFEQGGGGQTGCAIMIAGAVVAVAAAGALVLS